MKVLLYFEGEHVISKSGIGRALTHQKAALETLGIEYTTNPKEEEYDILHINTYGPMSAAMIHKARQQGCKIIFHAHSTEEDFKHSFVLSNQMAPVFKKLLVYLYGKSDHIITPTPYAKSLLESYGLTQPIHVISNGVDLHRFTYDEEKIKSFRDYFHLQPSTHVIISVGLFFERKGILDFIEVATRMPNYTFIWFGHVPLYSIPRNIRKIVTGNHPKNVIFPGYISGTVIEGAYCGADAFFFPSKEETEGIVVLEALASYQQVILRDIPVFDPWMQDGVNCYKGNTVDEFCSIIENVVEQKMPNLKKAGRVTAMDRSITEIGKQLKNVYEEVLKG